MLRLGLTGSIATGKSTVLDMIAAHGVPTISADSIVHSLYDGGDAVPPLGVVFPDIIHNGKVDRAALSRHLVAHPGDLATVEAIVHPLVRARINAFLDGAEAKGAPLAVVDVPLLFETRPNYRLDQVAVTTVNEAEQQRRALARPGMTVEKLATILARQMPQAEKMRRANYIIDTSESLDRTRQEVDALLRRLGASKGEDETRDRPRY